MTRGLAYALVAWALLACSPAGDALEAPAGPSPLLAMDGDRLWVLVQAARINPRCGAYAADPTDPRVAGLGPKCAESERNVLAWLHDNGAPTAAPAHLREPAFWEWFMERQAEILACRKRAREEATGAVFARMMAESSCDPYERITTVAKKTLQESGFREPGK